ncbi:hypothetical protein [Hymenobacter algoricola]|uniref:Glycosyltransferase RgtA/B/C/D-like domain-containing protein n=1 Tax=Hymenobacter algoricola TaxID=486267 RepID=A0ABP7NPK2_9BACT
MEIKDLFLTPIYLLLLYGIAFAIRPRVTNGFTRKFFIPGLSLKFLGAIALGVVYQFYYGYGDTLNYFNHVKIFGRAFEESPTIWWHLMTSDGVYEPLTYKYAIQMPWYRAGGEFVVVRLGAFFGLLCFHTYTVVGLFFALLSFSGIWAMYMTFVRIQPLVYKELGIACFYIPSVFFWGSGLMKDSICIGALGWVFYSFHAVGVRHRSIIRGLILGAFFSYALYHVKAYILLCFLPPTLVWLFNENSSKIRNKTLRLLAKPVLIIVGAVIGFLAISSLTDLDTIGEESQKTAKNIYAASGTEGSGYQLAAADGSLGSIAKIAPQAIVVALFRPFPWEARNAITLLSSLEAMIFLFVTARIIYQAGPRRVLALISSTPVLLLCFVFSLVFAIAVGMSSGNFGTLVRYKIPLMPFYAAGLYIIQAKIKQAVKRRPTSLATLRTPARV